MIPKILLLAVPTALLVVGVANAGETIHESAGALAQVVDKWNVSEPDKGHKLVEYAGRGVAIPDDPSEPMASLGCVGNYEYMPDGSWKGAGTCTDTLKVEIRQTTPGRRVRSSRSTRTNIPVALANTKAPVAAALTRTKT